MTFSPHLKTSLKGKGFHVKPREPDRCPKRNERQSGHLEEFSAYAVRRCVVKHFGGLKILKPKCLSFAPSEIQQLQLLWQLVHVRFEANVPSLRRHFLYVVESGDRERGKLLYSNYLKIV